MSRRNINENISETSKVFHILLFLRVIILFILFVNHNLFEYIAKNYHEIRIYFQNIESFFFSVSFIFIIMIIIYQCINW